MKQQYTHENEASDFLRKNGLWIVGLAIIVVLGVIFIPAAFSYVQNGTQSMQNDTQSSERFGVSNIPAGTVLSTNPYYKLTYANTGYISVTTNLVSTPEAFTNRAYYPVINSEESIKTALGVDSLYTENGTSIIFYGYGTWVTYNGTWFLFKSGGIWYGNIAAMGEKYNATLMLDNIIQIHD